MTRTRNTLLMSTAAIALMAGVGLAFAQTPAPGAPQSAPAEKTAPLQTPKAAGSSKAPESATKSGQTDVKADAKIDRSGAKAHSAQDNTSMKSKDSTVKSRDGTMSKDTKSGANVEPKSEDRTRAGMNQDRSRDGVNVETRTNTDARGSERTMDRSDRKFESRDRASASRSENLSAEQRSTIRTVITRHNVRPMTNVDFALTVGTRVPRTAHFNRVPAELVAIYPRWRGFEYVLVGEQILVVNPHTRMIVAILDA